jgi:hypothetical protein
VLAKSDDASLKTYVVWVPLSRGMERDVPKATSEIPDLRASHYWDGDGQLVKGYREVLGFSEPAWDIYLLYGPEAHWEGELPPRPLYWMHQLGSKRRPRQNGPFWDPAVFLEKVRQASNAAPATSQ